MKGIIEAFKNLFYRMAHIGLWTNKSDVALYVGAIVFVIMLVINTLGFVLISWFAKIPVTFVLKNMNDLQIALFWFLLFHTLGMTFFITMLFVNLYQRLVFEPVRDIKTELAGIMRSELSEYYVSGKISQPFRNPDSAITWEDQVKFYVDAALVEKYMDELTGCFNRKYFSYKLTAYMDLQKLSGLTTYSQVKKYGTDSYAIFMIDIDHFKSVNDDYGHAAGDFVLRDVGKLLRDICGDNGVVVRNGGEEFVIVYCEKYPYDFASLAEQINQGFRDKIKVPSSATMRGRNVTCSIGFVKYPFYNGADSILTLEQHVDLADMAMYISKQTGRDRWYELVAQRELTDKVDMVLYTSDIDYGIKRGFYQLRHKDDVR